MTNANDNGNRAWTARKGRRPASKDTWGQSVTSAARIPLPDGEPGAAQEAPFTELQWQYFKLRLKETWGIDLDGYREERIQSRVRSWMRRHQIATLEELTRRLQTEDELYELLQDALFINTSNFFRDEAVFVPLRERILPELIRRFGQLNIWSAGCSFGAEPYTVAMLLWDMGEGGRHRILGTDIDTTALRQAKEGRFHVQHLEKLPADLRRKYFTIEGDRAVIDPRIRQGVQCMRHDLLRDPVPAPGLFHLILCRNVLIYFTPEAQRQVLATLAGAIPVGGYLIIGGTEGVYDPHTLGLEREIHAVYRKAFEPEAQG